MGPGPFKSRCPEPVRNSRAHTYNTNCRPGYWDAAAAAHHVYTRAVQKNQTTVMEPSESMMLHDYSPKSLKLKFSQGRTRSHIDIYTRHQSGASTLSFLGDDSSPEKTKKHDSSFSEFPLVRHLLDRLHATSPRTNSASAARAVGQRLPCANVQDQVRVDRSHSLCRAPGGGKKHGNLTLLELLPPRFFFFWQKQVGGLRERRS